MTTPSILLVEDNAGDEALTLRALARSGFAGRVDIVRDGSESLDFLFGQANSFVRKPVACERFSHVVDEVARYWLQTNEPVRSAAATQLPY